MKKNSVYLLLIFLLPLQSVSAERMVYFKNKTNIPDKDFIYFIFSWHSPNPAQAAEDKKKHVLGFMTRFQASSKQFSRFPDQIDLDKLSDVHTHQHIPSDYVVDLKIITNQPSGLKTRGPEPETVYLTGSEENLKPGTYDVFISENGVAIQLKHVDNKTN
jgi:hypothetical protein